MSVLLRPDFRQNHVWYAIQMLDGRCLSRTHSLGHDGKWRWITNTIMGETGCEYDDIDLESPLPDETNEVMDYITVHGERYAVCTMMEDFSETAEHKQAMEEREVIVASAAAQQQIARLQAKVNYLQAEVDTWRDRYEAADEALEQCIRDWNRDREEVGR